MAWVKRTKHQRPAETVAATATPRADSAPRAPSPPVGPPSAPPTGRSSGCWPAPGATTPSERCGSGEYVETEWLPSKHIEPTTRAAYVLEPEQALLPFFGRKQLHQITPGLVQDWVTQAAAGGLSARSIRKYHTMLHSIFARAVRDQLIVANPCAHTELPKVVAMKTRTLTPDEFDVLITAVPDRHRLMVETAIETGMRWGELIALEPRHIDFPARR